MHTYENLSMHISEYENLFVDNRQIMMSHFYPVRWGEKGKPIEFSYGYWSDCFYCHGIAEYTPENGFVVL